MEIFAGNFSLKNQVITPDIDYDILETWEKSYFIMWADESITTHGEVLKFISQTFWELKTHDISIESKQSLEVISSEYEQGSYECVSFEWPQVEFSDILERFTDSMEVVCVREGEASRIYDNKIVKVDFIY